MLQRPKGTQDLLPEDTQAWQWLEATARAVFSQAGYGEIRTPTFEATELFARGVGETTDIVNKEMYRFEKGDRSLTLRPEGTAGVVRAFVEHGMARWPKPVRLYYLGPMFRYERPQAGRQREFHQIGVELFGLDTPATDVDVLALAARLLSRLGVRNLVVELNNLGTPACRQRFREALRQILSPALSGFCPTCQTRFETNPLRLLDCKVPTCQALLAQHSALDALLAEQPYLAPESRVHFEAVCQLLTALDLPYQHNPRLVRGLDYYTGLVFEMSSNQLGAQNAVCGGGRYNGLVQTLGGPATPAVGWAMGVERLLSLLAPPAAAGPTVYVALAQPGQQAMAFQVAEALTQAGIRTELDISGRKLKDQLMLADRRGAPWCALVDAQTTLPSALTLKHLGSGVQETHALSVWLPRLQSTKNVPDTTDHGRPAETLVSPTS